MRPLARKAIASIFIIGVGAVVGGMVPMVGRSVAGSAPVVAPVAATLPSVCEIAVYPYLPAECLHTADGRTVEDVRWVTIETRRRGRTRPS